MTTLHFAPFRLDPATQQVWNGDALVQVPAKPLAILQYLAENPHRLVTQQELVEEVWAGAVVSEGLVRGYIRDLRRLLEDDASFPRYIETVAGRGYRFVARVTHGVLPSSTLLHAITAFPEGRHIVGRQREEAEVVAWLQLAVEGERQTVFITGEPGIGKTTLLSAVLRRAAQTCRVANGQCVDQYGPGEAYLPVLDALGRLCRAPGGDAIVDVLATHAPTWLVQMPGLVDEARLESLRRRLEGASQTRMLRELAEALDVICQDQPVVLAIEDLQWSDPSTIDLISFLARRTEPARLLVVGTFRSADVMAASHPLKNVVEELSVHGRCRELAVTTLDEGSVERYLGDRFPAHEFSGELARAVYHSTEGNPLFMVALVDDLVSRGSIVEDNGRWVLRIAIDEVGMRTPDTVQNLIDSMIGRLSDGERRVLEACSIAGAEFTTAVVAAALDTSSDDVEECCEVLTRRRQFLRRAGTEVWPDGTLHSRYGVVHALYQQVALDRSPTARRQMWHIRIGERLESAFGTALDRIAPELALHFEQGGDRLRAARYHAYAAEQAMHRFAHAESFAHFTRGLEVLALHGESRERDTIELRLQTGLGPVLTATRGYASPEVEAVNVRALALAKRQGIDLSHEYFPVLYGIYLHSLTLAKFRLADEIAEQLERIATTHANPGLLAQALAARSTTVLYFGDLPRARELLERTLATYDPERDRALAVVNSNDPGVSATIQLALVEWGMGEPDRALATALRAVQLADATANPFLQVTALTYLARTHRNRREPQATRNVAERAMAIAAAHRFPFWHGEATLFRGWALVASGDLAGLQMMERGLEERLATAPIGKSTLLMVAADGYLLGEAVESGLRATQEALDFAASTEELAWRGEVLRIRAELLHKRGDRALALVSAREALAIAREQRAVLPAMRAAMALCRIDGSARDILAELRAGIQEGTNLPDLTEANTLLA